jgi:hypothetical protein
MVSNVNLKYVVLKKTYVREKMLYILEVEYLPKSKVNMDITNLTKSKKPKINFKIILLHQMLRHHNYKSSHKFTNRKKIFEIPKLANIRPTCEV